MMYGVDDVDVLCVDVWPCPHDPRAENMDGSIVLRNITHQDLGVYHCTITTFPLGSWSRDVTVEDHGRPPDLGEFGWGLEISRGG